MDEQKGFTRPQRVRGVAVISAATQVVIVASARNAFKDHFQEEPANMDIVALLRWAAANPEQVPSKHLPEVRRLVSLADEGDECQKRVSVAFAQIGLTKSQKRAGKRDIILEVAKTVPWKVNFTEPKAEKPRFPLEVTDPDSPS